MAHGKIAHRMLAEADVHTTTEVSSQRWLAHAGHIDMKICDNTSTSLLDPDSNQPMILHVSSRLYDTKSVSMEYISSRIPIPSVDDVT